MAQWSSSALSSHTAGTAQHFASATRCDRGSRGVGRTGGLGRTLQSANITEWKMGSSSPPGLEYKLLMSPPIIKCPPSCRRWLVVSGIPSISTWKSPYVRSAAITSTAVELRYVFIASWIPRVRQWSPMYFPGPRGTLWWAKGPSTTHPLKLMGLIW